MVISSFFRAISLISHGNQKRIEKEALVFAGYRINSANPCG
jgi:hypothetical protein